MVLSLVGASSDSVLGFWGKLYKYMNSFLESTLRIFFDHASH